jgi:UDP-3-O-[3-hydroxymyristoyl] glucosamine N-acyltransferase
VGPVRIQAGAVVEAGAEVGPEAVVAAGARVARGARIRRTVLWPGAVATGDLVDAVVTPTETIQIAD